MRLLNTTTLDLHDFVDVWSAPKYAILSHRWGKDEVSYKDYQKGLKKTGAGYSKIRNACKFASQYSPPLEWIWIDTCCIDKRSSAEQTEAINSMYEWYRYSLVCFAYLYDIESVPSDEDEAAETLKQSEWFERGWTLQELIAPRYVVILSKDWHVIGFKGWAPAWDTGNNWQELNKAVSAITRIPREILAKERLPRSASVAQRMSWVAFRKTTRPEDMAYCLLGIFDVNMPLFYGEGDKAFERLQLQIFSRNSDESIFAWTLYSASVTGILAECPSAFRNSHSVVAVKYHNRPPNTLTNRGLEVRLQSFRTSPQSRIFSHPGNPSWIYLVVNCTSTAHMPFRDKDTDAFIIVLHRTRCGHFNRIVSNAQLSVPQQGWQPFSMDETIYIHLTERDAKQCPDRLHADLPPIPSEQPE